MRCDPTRFVSCRQICNMQYNLKMPETLEGSPTLRFNHQTFFDNLPYLIRLISSRKQVIYWISLRNAVLSTNNCGITNAESTGCRSSTPRFQSVVFLLKSAFKVVSMHIKILW